MGPITRDMFAGQVARLVERKFPLVKVEPEEASFSLRLNGHLASLENLYRVVVQQPDDLQHHVERWVVELLRAAEGRPDEQADYEQVKDRIMPMLLDAGRRDQLHRSSVSQPLVEGLDVAYAIDSDRTIAYIHKDLFAKWGISIDDVHETALRNLTEKSSPLSVHAGQDDQGTVNMMIVQTMDGYDASRLLLPGLHEQFGQHLSSPFIAGVPNRDILVCFRHDPAMVQRLRQQIQSDFESMPHQITKDLFMVTPDGIAPYCD